MRIKESLNVRFDKSPPQKSSPLVDDDIIESQIIENQIEDLDIKENEPLNKEIINIKASKDHPIDMVIEPKNVKEAIQDESWTMAMQEELNQFKINDVWSLVPQPDNQTIIDNTLFTKKRDSHVIIVQIYVDDIIFRSTCQDLCDDFSKILHDEFAMSMMGELNFFLSLQIKQLEDGIFFNQSKYIKEMLNKFGLSNSKPIKTPMSSETKLSQDEEGGSVDDTKYRGMIGSLLYLMAS
ncbi:retrovirus-related pol polyprotein from transposon TNT 1-94 [Tanacetum coccineum]